MAKKPKILSAAEIAENWRARRRQMLEYYESGSDKKITYQKVGDKFGVSKQAASEQLTKARRDREAEQESNA